jgi:hypothetical protein
LLPGGSQPLLQGADIGIKDLGLVHAAGISGLIACQSRSDSRKPAYSGKKRTRFKSGNGLPT